MVTMIYVITGNKNKFAEFKEIMQDRDVRQLDIDIPEIQEADPRQVVRAKLIEGLRRKRSHIAVEDTSFHLSCMNGMPGPLVKWFLKSIGPEGIYQIARGFGNYSAEARCTIGYASSKRDTHFFEGRVKGSVVPPRGKNGFGWDVIFVPKGYDRTFGEMSSEEKNRISHRRLAADKLSAFLVKNKQR
jgi:non-canonical purine NTP pyrophosphatase (RdgB/HAM1 family)